MIAAVLLAAALAAGGAPLRLAVAPIRQAPARCGPAALTMVMRYYGADAARQACADSAYDPALRGTLITDLAACARRAGFDAAVERIDADSLVRLLSEGVPPVVFYQSGVGVLTRGHYAVVVGWDPHRRTWWVNDGGRATRTIGHDDLMRRWRVSGAQALVVRRAPS